MMNTPFIRRVFLFLVIPFCLQACVSTTTPLKYYDFGAITKSAEDIPGCRLPLIQLADITAPNALSSNLMLYRLLYANDQQIYSYANHRWNMTPTQLLTQRIKMQLAARGVRFIDNSFNNLNLLQLRLELEDFNHYFTDTTHSYAQLQVRASILRGGKLLAQTMQQQKVDANTPDAPGGAQAMRVATDDLILNLTHWLCEQEQQ